MSYCYYITYYLCHEALVNDPEREMLRLGARFGAPWKAARFVNIVEAKR